MLIEYLLGSDNKLCARIEPTSTVEKKKHAGMKNAGSKINLLHLEFSQASLVFLTTIFLTSGWGLRQDFPWRNECWWYVELCLSSFVWLSSYASMGCCPRNEGAREAEDGHRRWQAEQRNLTGVGRWHSQDEVWGSLGLEFVFSLMSLLTTESDINTEWGLPDLQLRWIVLKYWNYYY